MWHSHDDGLFHTSQSRSFCPDPRPGQHTSGETRRLADAWALIPRLRPPGRSATRRRGARQKRDAGSTPCCSVPRAEGPAQPGSYHACFLRLPYPSTGSASAGQTDRRVTLREKGRTDLSLGLSFTATGRACEIAVRLMLKISGLYFLKNSAILQHLFKFCFKRCKYSVNKSALVSPLRRLTVTQIRISKVT